MSSRGLIPFCTSGPPLACHKDATRAPNVIRRTSPERFVRRTVLLLPSALLFRGGARRILGWHADDLHPCATRDVHRVHDTLVLHLGIALHEDDLLRTR